MRSIAELKSSILQPVAETDDQETLNAILAYITEVKSSKTSVVAYDSKGSVIMLKFISLTNLEWKKIKTSDVFSGGVIKWFTKCSAMKL